MKYLRLTAFLLAFALLFAFSGCENNVNDGQNGIPEEKLVIYYDDDALTAALNSLTDSAVFNGRKIEAKLTNGLLSTLDTENAAAYIVDTKNDLSGFYEKGYFGSLTEDNALSGLTSLIPNGIQLNGTGIGNYGIPLSLEAYGYIVDTDMLKALFGAEYKSLLEDLRTCSYTDFEGFAAAVETYIAAPSDAAVTVNGTEYVFNAEKTGKAENLTGVFAMNAKDGDFAEYLLSTVLNAKFRNRLEVFKATAEETAGLKNLLGAYVEALDFHSSRVAGTEGGIGRGDMLTGGDFDYTASIDAFTKGYALFYPGSTADAADFGKSSEGFGENLDIIPMKLPLSESDITALDMTAEKLQSSIIIGSRYYLAVNPKAASADVKFAKELAKWLYSDEKGKALFAKAFGGVPFNYGYENAEEQSGSMPETSMDENSESGNSGNSASENLNSEARNAKKNNNGYTATASENLNSEARNARMNARSGENTVLSAAADYDSLTAAVAKYYAEGNWIPALTNALPAGFVKDILGDNLPIYWGKEIWETSDRENLADMIIGGWNEKIEK